VCIWSNFNKLCIFHKHHRQSFYSSLQIVFIISFYKKCSRTSRKSPDNKNPTKQLKFPTPGHTLTSWQTDPFVFWSKKNFNSGVEVLQTSDTGTQFSAWTSDFVQNFYKNSPDSGVETFQTTKTPNIYLQKKTILHIIKIIHKNLLLSIVHHDRYTKTHRTIPKTIIGR